MRLAAQQRTTLAASIAKLRAELGITEAELGRRSGVHPSQVNRICRGDFRTVSSNVMQICNVLGVDAPHVAPRDVDRGWERLERALRAVWDETPEGADTLVGVIEALGKLVRGSRAAGG